ncbi:efflux RND transporter permease subunit [soil metagenome]
MNLARFISNQKRAVIVIIMLVCLLGIYSAVKLPTAIFPQTDFPRVVIIAEDGEKPSPQMLVSVTKPIEEAMNGIPGIQRIKSTTARGSAEINLFFDWKVDIQQTLQFVQARLSQMSATLPPTTKITDVNRLTFAVFPVTAYSLTSETKSLAELREIATYTIRPRLARLAGIADITVQGGDVREFHITIDAEKLNSRGLSLTDVSNAVQNSNILASPGLLEENHQLELVLVSGQATTIEQLNKIVVGNINNAPVFVSDVATVGEGKEPNYTIVTADGKNAVLFNVLRQPNANSVTVADNVKTELNTITKQLPKDIKIAPFYDQSLLVSNSINSVRDAILIGLLLSVIILYAFLRNIGTTFVAILVIPVTILATFLAMWLVGLSFDLMTLGGVAAAIGLVIDDAIVVVENIFTHLSHGESRREAIERAISEITVPIIGSTITPVVVFLPLTLLTGVTGVFFRSLALTMAVSLLTSLVLALTFTPVLAEKFVKAGKNHKDENGRILQFIISQYEKVLNFSLKNRWLVIVASLIIALVSFILYENLGSEFLPSFDEGAFVLDYKTPPGSSLAETDRILKQVEEFVRETPEVESYSRRTGLQLGLAITEPNSGDWLVKLKATKKRSTEAVIDELRGKIEESQPALEIEFVGIANDLIGDLVGNPEPIEIKVFSEDATALHEKATEIEEAIQKVPNVVDTFNGVIVSGPALTFRVDAEKAARLGVNANDIANAVTTAMSGDVASNILERGKFVAVRVVLAKNQGQSLETLRGLMLHSASGNSFRLDQVADIEFDKGQTEINRDGLRQMVSVTSRISGSDLGSTITLIKEKLKEVKLPAGMTIEYGGLYAEQQSSFRELAIALGLAIVLVFLVLLIEFRSFAHPVAIVCGAILALSGVLLALFITKTNLNVVSLMGMIMVVGIVAKNGILMLDTVEENLEKSKNLTEVLIISGHRRFRPVLMTSLAAILGMLPLALALGEGSELLQPLAISVIGGLSVALLLSLIVTPTVYSFFFRKNNQ